MLCVRMTGHGEYRDNVSRVSLGMGMGCIEDGRVSVHTNISPRNEYEHIAYFV